MPKENSEFRIWAWGDCHVGTDIKHVYESLVTAITHSEADANEENNNNPFEWDIALDVGDCSGGQSVPEDEEGHELVRQFNTLKKHNREDIYNVCGNHDRSGLDEPEAWWWRKYVDPTGEHTEHSGLDSSRRPYPVSGTWERYSFRVGNLLFLMLSDINEPSQTIGRGDLGGNPGGVVRRETFEWWREMVEANPDSIIITAHHYMLKETTVASGEWEGMVKKEDGSWTGGYHGYKPQGSPRGASYLYWVGGVEDAQCFENYLAEHPGAIAMWLGGHTHAHPDAQDGNKSHIEIKWGVHFINTAALTRYHINPQFPNPPKSRLIEFADGSDEITVRCYIHTDEFLPKGWYDSAERTLKLNQPFEYRSQGNS